MPKTIFPKINWANAHLILFGLLSLISPISLNEQIFPVLFYSSVFIGLILGLIAIRKQKETGILEWMAAAVLGSLTTPILIWGDSVARFLFIFLAFVFFILPRLTLPRTIVSFGPLILVPIAFFITTIPMSWNNDGWSRIIGLIWMILSVVLSPLVGLSAGMMIKKRNPGTMVVAWVVAPLCGAIFAILIFFVPLLFLAA